MFPPLFQAVLSPIYLEVEGQETYLTRINCVPVEELTNKHLVAEYRELPRLFVLIKKAFDRGELPGSNAPQKYTLGKGHVRFFYDKIPFLLSRQRELISVMIERGYSPRFTNTDELLLIVADLPDTWFKEWTPSEEDKTINRNRIRERLNVNYETILNNR